MLRRAFASKRVFQRLHPIYCVNSMDICAVEVHFVDDRSRVTILRRRSVQRSESRGVISWSISPRNWLNLCERGFPIRLVLSHVILMRGFLSCECASRRAISGHLSQRDSLVKILDV